MVSLVKKYIKERRQTQPQKQNFSNSEHDVERKLMNMQQDIANMQRDMQKEFSRNEQNFINIQRDISEIKQSLTFIAL